MVKTGHTSGGRSKEETALHTPRVKRVAGVKRRDFLARKAGGVATPRVSVTN